MRNTVTILTFLAFSLAGVSSSLALPKGPRGENCNISSANGVNHTIRGENYVCDKCVFTTCDTSGRKIENCKVVTHYSNCRAGRQ